MYNIGEFIIYGHRGVCQVTSIDYSDVVVVEGEKRLYYKLQPVCGTETIFTPVDTKIQMRPVMTRVQADQLIQHIRQSLSVTEEGKQPGQQDFEAMLKNQNCEDLLLVMKCIYYKKQQCEQQGKKLTTTDNKILKQAEELLCSELSVVIDKDLELTKTLMTNAISEWLSNV